jgi:hypothetical protein
MKRLLCRLFMFLAFLQVPAVAIAMEAPVTLTHDLTSTFQGATALSLYYTVHLENTGDGALTDMHLSLVPLPPFTTRELVLNLAYLGAGETADLEVELLAPQALDFEALTFAQISFAVKCSDAEGRPVEFRVISHPTLMGSAK